MHVRIAEVDAHRVAAVTALDVFETRRRLVEGFLPGDALPAVRGAPHGMFEAIGVFMNVL